MSAPTPGTGLEIDLCPDHYPRLSANNPCDKCPSRPENQQALIERAIQQQIERKLETESEHKRHEQLLEEILLALKRFNNVYLAVASILIVFLMGFLLWNQKISEACFYAVTAGVLAPFYGPGLGSFVAEFMKPKSGGRPQIIGIVMGAFGAFSYILLKRA